MMHHFVLFLTVLRILGGMFIVFPLVSTGNFFLGGIFFILFGLTDYFDGKLARRFKVISHFGSLIDPLADKCLFYSAILPLTKTVVPLFMVYGFLLRDLIVGTLREFAQKHDMQIIPNKTGKLKTASVFLILTCILLFHSFIISSKEIVYIAQIFLAFSLFMSLKSFGEYVEKVVEQYFK